MKPTDAIQIKDVWVCPACKLPVTNPYKAGNFWVHDISTACPTESDASTVWGKASQ